MIPIVQYANYSKGKQKLSLAADNESAVEMVKVREFPV